MMHSSVLMPSNRTDHPLKHESMKRTALFLACLLTLCLMCSAQGTSSKGWKLLTTAQRDTLIQGPYSEFISFAAKRKVQDMTTRDKINVILDKNRQLRSYEVELSATNAALLTVNAQIRAYREQNNAYQLSLVACGEKVAAQRTWATIGKGFVIFSGAAVITGGVLLYLGAR